VLKTPQLTPAPSAKIAHHGYVSAAADLACAAAIATHNMNSNGRMDRRDILRDGRGFGLA
jgi:acyl-coenzyme A thioesterase PaaI-like protein